MKEIEQVIAGKKQGNLDDLSGSFYSCIPHNYGRQKMSNFVIRTNDDLKDKMDLVQNLADIKIAQEMVDEEEKKQEEVKKGAPIPKKPSIEDENYSKLNCRVETLQPGSAEHIMVKTYLDNTKGGSGWSYNRLELIDAFKIERPGEAERYNPNGYGNKMLLWHGSRFSNFVGILSQGLRIAPAEAPKTGYNFDKGVYLASMAEKSSAYCCASISNNVGLLLLCEAALGNTKVYSSFY